MDAHVCAMLQEALSGSPPHEPSSVIQVPASFTPPFQPVDRNRGSSLGPFLDTLPLEIQHEILSYLDLKSLSQLARVSVKGEAIVTSLLPLKILAREAGNACGIIVRTGIQHSVAKLYAVLYSEKCVTCGRYGRFLCLLTAQRCCYQCLLSRLSLQLFSLADAKEAFALTDAQLHQLHTLHCIPGTYPHPRWGDALERRGSPRDWSLPLVDVGSAKELALQIHESMELLDEEHPFDFDNAPDVYESNRLFCLYQYRHAPLGLLENELLPGLDCHDYSQAALFGGAGVVPLPWMRPDGVVEHGLYCRRCADALRQCLRREIAAEYLARLVPSGPKRPGFYLQRLKCRAYSVDGFVEHVKRCHLPELIDL